MSFKQLRLFSLQCCEKESSDVQPEVARNYQNLCTVSNNEVQNHFNQVMLQDF